MNLVEKYIKNSHKKNLIKLSISHSHTHVFIVLQLIRERRASSDLETIIECISREKPQHNHFESPREQSQ